MCQTYHSYRTVLNHRLKLINSFFRIKDSLREKKCPHLRVQIKSLKNKSTKQLFSLEVKTNRNRIVKTQISLSFTKITKLFPISSKSRHSKLFYLTIIINNPLPTHPRRPDRLTRCGFLISNRVTCVNIKIKRILLLILAKSCLISLYKTLKDSYNNIHLNRTLSSNWSKLRMLKLKCHKMVAVSIMVIGFLLITSKSKPGHHLRVMTSLWKVPN